MSSYGEQYQETLGRQPYSTDFKNAAKSVKNVVTTLGRALISIYKDNEEIFGWRLIGDNPFAMVCKSTSEIGNLISSISAGIKDYADLRMPIYDENGKIVGHKPMGSAEFTEASKNINIVLTTLSNALISTYKANPTMFTDPSSWHTDADKTPIGMVAKSLSGVGTLIKDAALGIKEILDMKLDETALKELQGTKANQYKDGKVGRIVSILADSILQTYNSNPKIFKDDSFWHTKPEKTPFGMVMQCLNQVTPFIQEVIKNVDGINKMEGLTSDQLSENGEVYKKIKGVVRVLPAAIISLLDTKKYKDYLEEGDNIEKLQNMSSMFTSFAEMTTNASNSVKTILEMDFGENDKKFNSAMTHLADLISGVASTISNQLNLYSNLFKTDSSTKMLTVFKNVTSIVEELYKSYNKILESFSLIGITATDSTNLDNIIRNLDKMIINGVEAILYSPALSDGVTMNKFSGNMDIFSSSIDKLITTYSKVPKDATIYDNVVKAIEGVNNKIAEINNVDAFKQEQEALSKYVLTINNLDLTKTRALTSLMEAMNELATKLGALDNFTDTLNKKISVTLAKLAEEIRKSGNIIYKADELQNRRQRAIKESITEIQKLMSKKLEVEIGGELDDDGGKPGGPKPNPVVEQPTVPGDNDNVQNPNTNNLPPFMSKYNSNNDNTNDYMPYGSGKLSKEDAILADAIVNGVMDVFNQKFS